MNLAKEWQHLLSYYMNKWTISAGAENFVNPGACDYELSEDFVNWATTLDVESVAFMQVVQLRHAAPVLPI